MAVVNTECGITDLIPYSYSRVHSLECQSLMCVIQNTQYAKYLIKLIVYKIVQINQRYKRNLIRAVSTYTAVLRQASDKILTLGQNVSFVSCFKNITIYVYK